jgi:hypothetical protein
MNVKDFGERLDVSVVDGECWYGDRGIAIIVNHAAPDWPARFATRGWTGFLSPRSFYVTFRFESNQEAEDFMLEQRPQLSGREVQEIFVFAYTILDELIFVGVAKKTGIGGYGIEQIAVCSYLLANPLSTQVWHQIGGYSGWAVARGVEYEIINPDLNNCFSINALYFTNWGKDYTGIHVTRSESDHLIGYSDRDQFCIQYIDTGGKSIIIKSAKAMPADISSEVLLSELYQDICVKSDCVMSWQEAADEIVNYISFGKMRQYLPKSGLD